MLSRRDEWTADEVEKQLNTPPPRSKMTPDSAASAADEVGQDQG